MPIDHINGIDAEHWQQLRVDIHGQIDDMIQDLCEDRSYYYPSNTYPHEYVNSIIDRLRDVRHLTRTFEIIDR